MVIKLKLLTSTIFNIFIIILIWISVLSYFFHGSSNQIPFSANHIIAKNEKVRERFIQKRETILRHGRNLKDLSLWKGHVDKATTIWNFFPPTFTCPHLVERIGTPADGGKWLCGLETFENNTRGKDCVVYSFGVSMESSFEVEIVQRTECKVFAYDHTVNAMMLHGLTPEQSSRIHFFKKGLSGEDNPKKRVYTLDNLMQQNGHDWIDFLKMDVEGSEFGGFQQILKEFPDTLPFGHLNIEIHLGKGRDQLLYGKYKYPKGEKGDFLLFYDMMTILEERGLRVFSWEDNHSPCLQKYKPDRMEYSLINIKNKRNRLLFF